MKRIFPYRFYVNYSKKHSYLPPKCFAHSKSVESLLDEETSDEANYKLKKADLLSYLKSNENLKTVSEYIPDRFLRIKKLPPFYSFVVDENVASEIVQIFKPKLSGNSAIVDGSPGLGLITRHLLLETRPSRILVFDPMFTPLHPLLQLINEHPDKITVIPSNYFEIHKFIYQDNLDGGNRFETMVKDIEFRQWTEDPCIRVFGIILSPMYIHNMLKSIAFRDVFVKIGRVEHFVAIADDLYLNLTKATGRIRLNTFMLFNEFLEVEEMGKLPRKAFLPWHKAKEPMENRVMYLVKLTPKADIYDKFTDDNLRALWYFMLDLGRSKQNKIIAYFEKWMPNSGLRLIHDGLSPMTEVQNLSSRELMQIFYTFMDQPEFADTNYLNIQQSGILSDNSVDEKSTQRKKFR